MKNKKMKSIWIIINNYISCEVLKDSLRWVLPFIMISFVGLLETWIFESISGEWNTIISETITFSTLNLGFFLGVTFLMSLVISRQRHKGIHRESRLYGMSLIISSLYIVILFPAMFTHSLEALKFLNGGSYQFKEYQIQFFQMYLISWVIQLFSLTWFIVLVVRGDWRGIAISKGIAIIVKAIVYFCLIYGSTQYRDERLLLTMAYSSIALRIVEHLCYFLWNLFRHRDALTEVHKFHMIPRIDLNRIAKVSLILINPIIYNFVLFFSWRFIFNLSNEYAGVIAVVLPLFNMVLYGSRGLSHSVPNLIMARMAKKQYNSVFNYAVSLKRAAWIVGIIIGVLMFIPLIILGLTQTFKGENTNAEFYYNSLLIIGAIYCLICPLVIQFDTLATIMLSSGKTWGPTLFNIVIPLLSLIILGFLSAYAKSLESIWWIICLIFVVNLRPLCGVFYTSWVFKKKKWLQRLK